MARDINIGIFAEDSGVRKSFDSIKNSMNNLGRQTKSTTGEFSNFYNKTRKLNNRFGNITKDANRSANSINKLGGSFKGLSMAIKGISFFALGQALGQMVQSSLDMVETTHLFNVALGDMAVLTNETLENLSQLYGLDITNLRSFAGTYASLGRSMGMVTNQSAQLSTNMVQLGIDLSSLYNVPINQVMQDLRSGLVGQSETVYKYGMDVTEASLKQEALNLGIEKSVRNMTQGEKMYLRQSVMMRQAGLSMEDFSETINQPANQLKILGERFVTLGRSIGSVFQPVLQRVLPYLQAIVIVITDVMNALALLLGYEPPKIENTYTNMNGALNDTADSLDGVSGSANDATDAIKKFKNVTLGFDELNIIKEPEAKKPSSGSGSGGGFGGSGIFDGMEIPDYGANISVVNKATEMADNLKQKLLELKEIAKPTTDALGRLWNDGLKPIGDFVFDNIINWYTEFLKPVGEWILGEGLPRLLDVLTNLLKDINWSKLTEALKNLYKALAPFVISIGRGLINFIEQMAELLKPVLLSAVDAFADAINSIADALNDMDEKDIEKIGEAIGALGLSFMILKGVEKTIQILTAGLNAIKWLATAGLSLDPSLLVVAFDPVVAKFEDWIEKEAPDWVKVIFEAFGYALAGGTTGALAGSWIPVLGTTAGAIVGALVGLIGYAFKDAEWEDLWGVLMPSSVVSLVEGIDWNELWTTITDWAEDLKGKISDAWDGATEPIKDVFAEFKINVSTKITEIKEWWENRAEEWKDKIASFKIGIGTKIREIIEWWQERAKEWKNKDGKFSISILTPILTIITGWLERAREWKNKDGKFSISMPTWVSTIITRWSERAKEWKNKTSSFKISIGTAISSVKTWWNSRAKEWKNKTSTLSLKLTTTAGNVKNFVNNLISQINSKVIAKLDFSIKAPYWLGGGSWGWKAPRIKYLAQGGIVNSPTLSMVGEAGKEAVIPLENNTGWIDTLAGDIVNRGGLGGGSLDKNMVKTAFKEALKESNFGDTVLYVGNEELARASNKGNKMLNRRYKLVLE